MGIDITKTDVTIASVAVELGASVRTDRGLTLRKFGPVVGLPGQLAPKVVWGSVLGEGRSSVPEHVPYLPTPGWISIKKFRQRWGCIIFVTAYIDFHAPLVSCHSDLVMPAFRLYI